MMYKMYIIIGKMMKTNKKLNILCIALAIIVILYCLTSAIQQISYDTKYYKDYVDKNELAKQVNLDEKQIFNLYDSLIKYIDTGDESLIKDNFNNREVLHMKDVHQLFNLNNQINKASMLVFYLFILMNFILIMYKEKSKTLTKKDLNIFSEKTRLVKNYTLVIIGVMLILTIFIASDFSKYFIKFHELFFDNDLWLLDPKTDIMIRMLPEDYFMKMASRIAFSFISKLAIIIIILIGLSHLAKRRQNV